MGVVIYKNNLISLVIPTKNEKINLKKLLPLIPEYIDEVIIVDANSRDGTAEFANMAEAVNKVFIQSSPGKGSALCIGLQNAKHEYILCMDSDGSMSPKEFPLILDHLIFSKADVVKGSRYLVGGGSDDLSVFRSLGNRVLLAITKILYKCTWTELAYGYFGLSAAAVRNLDLADITKKLPSGLIFKKEAYGQGFEIEAVVFCRAVRRNLKIMEFPSYEQSRWNGTSNLKAIKDGARVLIAIFIERLRSQRKY